MEELEQIETTVEQLRDRDEDDVSVDLEVLADKLAKIARYARDCRDQRAAAEEQTEEMRRLLDERYREGYEDALADMRDVSETLTADMD